MRTTTCIGLVALSIAGCALLGTGEESLDQRSERADASGETVDRGVDIFRKDRGTPDVPIESAEQAIASALTEASFVQHLRMIDARYHGKRQKGLAWTADAQQTSGEAGPWRVEIRANAHGSSADYVCAVDVTREGETIVQDPPRRSCGWQEAR